MKVTVSRKAHFNAAHKLFRWDWSDEKNKKVFGKCANENYHGHNYELIVSLTGEIDKETGYVYDLGKLKNIIKVEVEEYLDHKNLNLDIDDFKWIDMDSLNKDIRTNGNNYTVWFKIAFKYFYNYLKKWK